MKHNIKITIALIVMFFLTQLIGLFVISIYNNPINPLPFFLQPPEEIQPQNFSVVPILIAFVFAIGLFFLLTKIKAEKFIRFWFFIVTALAISLTLKAVSLSGSKDFIITNNVPILSSIIPEFSIASLVIFFIIAIPLAIIKIYKRNTIIHNITELLIYPGIAAVFIPILNVFGIIILLLAISFYDIWAVWHSQFMQKIANFQINTLKFFTGFFIPYADKKTKEKISSIKQKYKDKPTKFIENKFQKSGLKVNLAILGGGDIIFPIITAGIFYKYFGLIPAFVITISATLALSYLLISAKKGRFYPAMPFLTIGMFIGMLANWLLLYFKIV